MLRPVGGAGLDAESWARTRRLARWLEQVLGQGRPLDDAVRRQMEGFFGCSLEDVRIHDSHQAGEVARRLGGEAFTIGGQVFGDTESLNTLTPEGTGLMAHELTHFIQQTQPAPVADSAPTASQQAVTHGAGVSPQPQGAQFAGHTPSGGRSGEEPMEAEALASEAAARQAAEGAEQPERALQEVDVEKLADRVYQLMRQELRADRDRSVRST
jgi:hypothetical protein